MALIHSICLSSLGSNQRHASAAAAAAELSREAHYGTTKRARLPPPRYAPFRVLDWFDRGEESSVGCFVGWVELDWLRKWGRNWIGKSYIDGIWLRKCYGRNWVGLVRK